MHDLYSSHHIAEECLEPYRYISSMPGKRVRSRMIDCFQLWMQAPAERVEQVKEIVALLHNASLLVDDIEDDSLLRRGKPVAHKVFGVPQTLNCANYIYFVAMDKVLSLNSPNVLPLFTKELLDLHRGQGLDLFWRDSGRCPTEEEYVHMVQDKTGGLFRLGVGLMKCFATENVKTDFTPLVNLLSVYFQVRDDLINLASEEYHRNKSYCEDLTEGKFSFPIIHGIQNSPKGDTRVITILKQRTTNHDLKLSVVTFLREETRSFIYTKSYLEDVFDKIVEQTRLLGGNDNLLKLMSALKKDVDACIDI